MTHSPEQIIRVRGYIVIASLFCAFVAKSMLGGFFWWLFTYTLLTTALDLLMIHRFGMVLDAGSHDFSTEDASTSESLEPDQMETIVNRALQQNEKSSNKQVDQVNEGTFMEKFGISAGAMNKYFETQASVRLWCFGIAALHAAVGYLVDLNYERMFIQLYILLRFGCFAYGVFIRTTHAART